MFAQAPSRSTGAATTVGSKITGGGTGFINTSCGVASFGFNVQRKVSGGPVTGSLTYTSPGAGIHLKATSFSTFTVSGNSGDFSGTCKNNGVICTFSVHVEDNGTSGTTDKFVISISNFQGGTPQGGVLRSGNIQIH